MSGIAISAGNRSAISYTHLGRRHRICDVAIRQVDARAPGPHLGQVIYQHPNSIRYIGETEAQIGLVEHTRTGQTTNVMQYMAGPGRDPQATYSGGPRERTKIDRTLADARLASAISEDTVFNHTILAGHSLLRKTLNLDVKRKEYSG